MQRTANPFLFITVSNFRLPSLWLVEGEWRGDAGDHAVQGDGDSPKDGEGL